MLSINSTHTGQREYCATLLTKVQLNALGLIRLAIMLWDWLAFFFSFRRRRRQVSHVLFSKPILKQKIKKATKSISSVTLLAIFSFDGFWTWLFFLNFFVFFFVFLYFFQKKKKKSDHVFRNVSLHTTSATQVGNTWIFFFC